MPSAKRKHEPIRQSIHVDCPIEDAFRLFTEGFGEWWPLALYSVTGAEAKHCILEPWTGGRVFERTVRGEEEEWGSVIAWNPPERLRLSWHPGRYEDRNQTVDIEFQTDAQGTRVTVIHTGWQTTGVAVCSLQSNGTGIWSAILRAFSVFVPKQILAIA